MASIKNDLDALVLRIQSSFDPATRKTMGYSEIIEGIREVAAQHSGPVDPVGSVVAARVRFLLLQVIGDLDVSKLDIPRIRSAVAESRTLLYPMARATEEHSK